MIPWDKKVVTTHVVRLKLFRLKAEGAEKHECRTLAEISDFCIKHGFKMRFFLIPRFAGPSAYPPE